MTQRRRPQAGPQSTRVRWLAVALAGLTGQTVLASAGCNKPERPHPAGPGVTEANKAAAKLESVPKVGDKANESQLTPEQQAVVVAKIGERTITLGELEARLAAEPLVIRSQFASLQKRKDYLAKWVQFEVMAQEAQKRGLDKDPEVVEAYKQALIKQFLTKEVGTDVDPASITDAEIQQYFDANPQLFQKPEQVEVSHMLLANEDEARKVVDQLRAGSEGNTAKLVTMWNDYVVRLSQDKVTAPQLGALGLVSRTPPPGASEAEIARLAALPKPLVDAAFAAEPLVLPEPVQSPAGWHVLLVTSKSPAVNKTLAEVKESIRARIVKRERDLRRDKFIADLQAAAKVQVDDDAVRLIPPPKMERAPNLKGGHDDGHGHDHDEAPPSPAGAPATPPAQPANGAPTP